MLQLNSTLTACGLTVLLAAGTAAQAQGPTVTATGLMPARNAVAAPRATNVVIPFSQAINPATADSIRVFSAQYRGRRTVAASTSGSAVTLVPTAPAGQAAAFRPGETVQVTVPGTVQNMQGRGGAPYVYQFTAAATGGTGGFAPGSDVAMGNGGGYWPEIKVGDLDGDGDLDFAMAYGGYSFSLNNKVKVGLNNGNGMFTLAPDVTTGDGAEALTLADVDGDGDLDILTGTTLGGSSNPNGVIALVRNTGSASFAAPVIIGTGYVRSIAVGDVDGDGDLDVVAGRVFLNDGRGNFALGAAASGMALGDVDNDGDLDLVGVTNSTGTVQLNDGHGNFTVGAAFTVAGDKGLTLGDLDGDGDLDLLTVNFGGGTTALLSIRLNDGTGSFGGTTNLPDGTSAWCLALGDVDGDGDLDILTPDTGNPMRTHVRFNDGTGDFSRRYTFNNGGTLFAGIQTVNMALGDLDSDGDLDLLLVDYTADYVGVRLNGAVLATAAPQPLPAGALWPNPASATQPVQVSLTVPGDVRAVQATVLNSLGQQVARATLPVQAGQATGALPTAGLPAGVYVVQLQAGAQRFSQRLVLL
ncbi:FG-GAP-like repeat-containing protein [Hymenobacter sp. ASUV-10]|uniref:FG-GAP-like repeat-containing protein n=1 Tax=Hymenobacter aranciens TaxID=3063996 RepID=A0ABT9B917_9BACT|nr:FG-GAP-like repeat-containing protein [Hymenobacter sp. ASUV-10]MDO7873522.1 FG-GAP-like repeat-containing protein [Hymenobacter sp. ASUV-10]